MEKEMNKQATKIPPPTAAGQSEQNTKPKGVRTASKEQFEKAHRKTSAQHAGLFRRLAK